MKRLILITAAVTTVVVGGLTALLLNVVERKQEAKNPFFRVVDLTDDTDDPAVWGKNFPLQYDGYRRTTDQQRTRFGGSEAMPRTPTQADPRSVVAQSRLEEDPRLKTMWAGYAFAVDFREERGPRLHAGRPDVHRAPEGRRSSPAPACSATRRCTCRCKKLGGGDLVKGFEAMNDMPYTEARTHVKYPVACIDCHDPATHAAARDAPGIHRRHARAQGVTGRGGLRRQHDGDPAGDAVVRVRAVPRRVLLQGTGEAPGLPVGQGPERRARCSSTTTRSGTRTGRTPRRAPTCSRRSTRSSRSGTRASTRGRAWRARTATCPTSARARSRSATTTSGARCSTSTARARRATSGPRRS